MKVFSFFCCFVVTVFGFNQTEFIGEERLQNYAVEIGFLSGLASQEVTGSIKLTPVTAGNVFLHLEVIASTYSFQII